MLHFSSKPKAFIIILFLIFTVTSFAQQGQVDINQDHKIDHLLNVKKELNKTENSSDRYKIQIYNGNRSGAYAAQKEFHEIFSDWKSRIEYESPNFKIWAGNFRTRLEADRALKRIKKEFPSAFIFKPKSTINN
ncbi:SPOR domain-containing protein [Seonamhaeicola aphaedonensis]|uniref:Sporulation related protein n=1 Tax=Seonamhaeicola aphaedonensis TaxID=1461338 RepID=A0A3D9HGX5_9FLAO|nr:SPOR domain-containing protein [Seonamhaeicola aphaedonensis]RED48713.1 sporulation related protein [Seonamhaeicola aphaedonensis]